MGVTQRGREGENKRTMEHKEGEREREEKKKKKTTECSEISLHPLAFEVVR